MKFKNTAQIALPWAVGHMQQMRHKFFAPSDAVTIGLIAGALLIHEQEFINVIV